jgi:hypothetical protein
MTKQIIVVCGVVFSTNQRLSSSHVSVVQGIGWQRRLGICCTRTSTRRAEGRSAAAAAAALPPATQINVHEGVCSLRDCLADLLNRSLAVDVEGEVDPIACQLEWIERAGIGQNNTTEVMKRSVKLGLEEGKTR